MDSLISLVQNQRKAQNSIYIQLIVPDTREIVFATVGVPSAAKTIHCSVVKHMPEKHKRKQWQTKHSSMHLPPAKLVTFSN